MEAVFNKQKAENGQAFRVPGGDDFACSSPPAIHPRDPPGGASAVDCSGKNRILTTESAISPGRTHTEALMKTVVVMSLLLFALLVPGTVGLAQEEAGLPEYLKALEFYERGEYSETVKWLRQSVERNHPLAQDLLGECYYNGHGVEQSETEAVKWYRKAADQGSIPAQFNLAYCYETGNGVTKSLDEAVKWYKKAAEQGDEQARDRVKELAGN